MRCKFCRDLGSHYVGGDLWVCFRHWLKLCFGVPPTEEHMSDDIPRRNRMDKMTPAELAIQEAVRVVEGVGADVRLTQAVILLGQARDKVADYVDNVGATRFIEPNIVWRGSVSDLITDISYVLYAHEFEELKRRLTEGEGTNKTKPYPPRGAQL